MECVATKAMAHVDLKEAGYEAAIVRMATDIMGAENFVVTSLIDSSIKEICRAFPRIQTALSLRAAPITSHSQFFPLRRLRDCGAKWLAMDKNLARFGVLERCWRNGIGAMVWTVDEDILIDKFLRDLRVEVVVTNRPGRAVQRRTTLGLSRR
jgi:glycerophosphoryl diester phosphodiesterase